ncbi:MULTISPECIES: alpha/beta fold hydrolase [Gordonia]|uniref:Putative hydrolase n=1 Tax=Gordonia sihwensis NBRC 108236 TaxID=1223544 RepID=L7LQ95_9ACTN|nr:MULTISPECIES: alpha/beta fold hydrolase [Gordonia]AUH68580.1 alpha/beta hydrolase [Gordonia sp. YC-JH1]GAC62258.1 putative hydrolase [Gordonia sihwensis NBRC 108236]
MNPARRDLTAARAPRVRLPRVDIPAGRLIELPGRGSTYVTDTAGPTADAPAIVLLHALTTTGLLTWFPSIPELSKRFRVITLDLRWHGQGIKSPEFSLRDCADDAVALLDVLGIDEAMFAGFSMGSLVAQRVWRQHPDRAGGLVLCASTDAFQMTATERVFHNGMAGITSRVPGSGSPRRAGRVQASQVDPAVDINRWALNEFRSTSPIAVGKAVGAIGRHHTRPWISQIDVPTAVVVPLRDRAIPPARQIAMARRIPGATVHEVDGGHSCCVIDADKFVPVFAHACSVVRARWRERAES